MKAGPTRYTARMFAGGHWRVWDRELHEWLGDTFPSYPNELLRSLKGPPTVNSFQEQPPEEDRTGGRIRVGYFAAAGAALAVPLAVWLLLPGPPSPGEEEEPGPAILAAFIFGPVVGALVGGLLGRTVGRLFNRWVRRRSSTPRPAVMDDPGDACD